MRNRNMRRTHWFALVVATCLLCLVRPTFSDVGTGNNKTAGNGQEPKTPHENPAVIANPNIDVGKSDNNNTVTAAAVVDTKANSPNVINDKNEATDTENNSKFPEQSGIGHGTSLNPGALLRGFYVFVGLSVLALAYIVFRSFRLNKSRTQMVRKYGVLAHKQDIEMRPLPLDEDDEDDTTVFDASGLSPPRLQS